MWKNNDHLSSKFFFLTTNLTLSVICYWIDARSLRVASPPQGETRRLRRTVTRNLFVKLTITGFKPEFRDLTKAIIIRVKSSQVKSPWLPLKMSITDIINSPFPEPRWRGWSHTHKYPPPPFPPSSSSIPRAIHTYRYGSEKKKELFRQSLFPAFFQSYKFFLTWS